MVGAQVSGNAAPPAQASLLVAPAPFAQWNQDSLQLGGFAPPVQAAPSWFGLNTGAAMGATTMLFATQAFCRRSDGCVAQSIAYSLLGTLLGGAIDAGLKY